MLGRTRFCPGRRSPNSVWAPALSRRRDLPRRLEHLLRWGRRGCSSQPGLLTPPELGSLRQAFASAGESSVSPAARLRRGKRRRLDKSSTRDVFGLGRGSRPGGCAEIPKRPTLSRGGLPPADCVVITGCVGRRRDDGHTAAAGRFLLGETGREIHCRRAGLFPPLRR